MLTRDSYLWNILMTLGLVLGPALIAISTPADYGLSTIQLKWLQLIATGMVALGKLGNSPLAGKGD